MDSHLQPTIAIVGFGYIGCTLGAVLSDRGFNVVGVERDDTIRTKVLAGETPFAEPGLHEILKANVSAGRLAITDDFSVIADVGVILVSVGTPLGGDGRADLSAVEAALYSIAKHVKEGQLVILKSTLPPGTTRDIVAPILKASGKAVKLAFCPERIAEGQAIKDLLSIPMVVGGINDGSAAAATDFFQNVLGVNVVLVSDTTTAEMSKLADNLWIDLNIALANEIAQLSDKLGIDALEVIDAANSLPKLQHNVNILLPSIGVGGYCLTKDPWFVHQLGSQYQLDLQIPTASRTVNDRMPYYAAKLILDDLVQRSIPPPDSKIALLGLSFKSNTGDCRFTPTAHLIDKLKEAGCQISCYDPWVSDEDFENLVGGTRSKSITQTVEGVDVIAFLTGHDEFKKLPLSFFAKHINDGALVFDGRIYFSQEQITEIKKLGMRYKGVGR